MRVTRWKTAGNTTIPFGWDESDGSLCVVQRAHDSGDIAAVGELFFSDSGLHLQVIKTNFETHKFTSVTIRNDGEDTLHITIGSDETALPTGEETTLTYADFEVRTSGSRLSES